MIWLLKIDKYIYIYIIMFITNWMRAYILIKLKISFLLRPYYKANEKVIINLNWLYSDDNDMIDVQ